ncbi:3-hydroxyacyl-CoA dehydrogenase [Burkholderia lata]|uniref:3-hydroxyacyl-CoA dehydrogenase n=1 Tax=Burkholderia lata (strain ATCC 17760 / DSM 23089 / LMG 22485 / NCIMB 9086 / R18194 / 383) TaxID=482957 RepID=A0A6P2WM02_BURL3|nr:3-hydroxyacyl-CoA dehydrogenase [Burkholderia lata]
MKIDPTNRVAIVTGACTGLGREPALLLARPEAKVVINDRPPKPTFQCTSSNTGA